MVNDYSDFIKGRTDYWRKAKQYEFQDINRIILALQNLDYYTTRNTMSLRILGLVNNLGNDQLEVTNAGDELIKSSDKQTVIDEQLLKISLSSSINSGINIPVLPTQVIYMILKQLEYLTFEEYMLFVCWITDKSEVPRIINLIKQHRSATSSEKAEVLKIFEKKKSERGTKDFADNISRLFAMFALSSYIVMDGTRTERVLFRNSSPDKYQQLSEAADKIPADNDKYIEFDHEYQSLIAFKADHKEITESLQDLSNAERKLLRKAIVDSEALPELGTVSPTEVSPNIVAPPTSKAKTSRKSGTAKKYKPNYAVRENRNRIVGLHTENVVIKYEYEKLISSGKSELAEKIQHVSVDDDSLGYDVVSYSPEGKEKHIEVKAVDGFPTTFRFFISANEIEKAENDPAYAVFIVFDCKGKEPKVWEFPNVFKSSDPRIRIEPVKFTVTVTIQK